MIKRNKLVWGGAVLGAITSLGIVVFIITKNLPPDPLTNVSYPPNEIVCSGETSERCAAEASRRLKGSVAWIPPGVTPLVSYVLALTDQRVVQELHTEGVAASLESGVKEASIERILGQATNDEGVTVQIRSKGSGPRGDVLAAAWELNTQSYVFEIAPVYERFSLAQFIESWRAIRYSSAQ